MATSLINAALFFGGARRFRNVNIDITDEYVNVLNNINGDTISSFRIVDVAKPDEAFDAYEVGQPEVGPPLRLITQLGCGCSGQKPYEETPEYKTRAIARAATV